LFNQIDKTCGNKSYTLIFNKFSFMKLVVLVRFVPNGKLLNLTLFTIGKRNIMKFIRSIFKIKSKIIYLWYHNWLLYHQHPTRLSHDIGVISWNISIFFPRHIWKLLKNMSFIKQLHKFTNKDGMVGGGIGSFICNILCKWFALFIRLQAIILHLLSCYKYAFKRLRDYDY